MKILYAITKSNWGGAQRHLYDLAVAMKSKGNEAIAAVGGEGMLKDRLEAAGVFTHSISALGRDMSVGKDLGSFKELFSIIRQRKPDILHLHSPKAAGIGALAGRILRVKRIVYTVHGWAFNESRPIHEKALIAVASWFTMLLCHKVILLSNREYKQTLAFPWVKNKLALIPLGLRPTVLMSVDGAKQFIAKKAGVEYASFAKRQVVGAIAELHPNKGLPYLVAAAGIVARQNRNALFIVMGGGEEMQRLQALIEKEGLADHFKLLGYVENAAEYLKAFGVFVLPSIKEGLPYAILEAGAASLPIVATTVGGIPEMIDDMRSGILVQPKNAKELAHALSFMLEHPAEARGYATALHDKVLKDFSIERMIAETEKAYSDK